MVHEFSDLTFTVQEGVQIPAHKVIVFTRCPSLRDEFGAEAKAISLLDINDGAMTRILEYLYTDYTYVEEGGEIVEQVLRFSEKYQLPKLSALCGNLSGNVNL